MVTSSYLTIVFVQPTFSPSFPSIFSAQAPTTTGPTTSEAVGSDLGSPRDFRGGFPGKNNQPPPWNEHFAARPASLGAPKGDRFFFSGARGHVGFREGMDPKLPNFFPKFLIEKFPVPIPTNPNNLFFWVVVFAFFVFSGVVRVTSQQMGKFRIRPLEATNGSLRDGNPWNFDEKTPCQTQVVASSFVLPKTRVKTDSTKTLSESQKPWVNIIPGLESKWLITSTFLTRHPSPFTLHPGEWNPLLLSRALATWPVDLGRCPNETWAVETSTGDGYLHGVKQTASASKGGVLLKKIGPWSIKISSFLIQKKTGLQTPNSKKPPTQNHQFYWTWSGSVPKKNKHIDFQGWAVSFWEEMLGWVFLFWSKQWSKQGSVNARLAKIPRMKSMCRGEICKKKHCWWKNPAPTGMYKTL